MIPLLLLAASVASAQQLSVSLPALGSGQLREAAPSMLLELQAGGRCINPEQATLQIYPLGLDELTTVELLPAAGRCTANIEAVLPAGLPHGPVELFLATATQRYGPAFLRIVPHAFRILERDPRRIPESSSRLSSAYPAMVQFPSGAAPTLLRPAIPGDTLRLRGTGWGMALLNQTTVRLGTLSIRPRSLNPAPGAPGLVDLEFAIPSNVPETGCYVPLTVDIAGKPSNTTSIPLMHGPTQCNHRFGLSPAQARTLEDGGTIPAAIIGIHSNDLGRLAFSPFRESIAVMPRDLDRSLIANLAGLDLPNAPACQTVDSSAIPSSLDAFYSQPGKPAFDAGPALTLTGPRERFTTVPLSNSRYSFSSFRPDTFFLPGQWDLRGSPTAGMPLFRWTFEAPPRFAPLNQPLAPVGAGPDPLIEWDGSSYSPSDRISFYVVSNGSASLRCEMPARTGAFRLPVNAFLKSIENFFPAATGATIEVRVTRTAPARAVSGDALGLVEITLGSNMAPSISPRPF